MAVQPTSYKPYEPLPIPTKIQRQQPCPDRRYYGHNGVEAQQRMREVNALYAMARAAGKKMVWAFAAHAAIAIALCINSIEGIWTVNSLWDQMPFAVPVLWGLASLLLLISMKAKKFGARYVIPFVVGLHATYIVGPAAHLALSFFGGEFVTLRDVETVVVPTLIHIGLAVSAYSWGSSVNLYLHTLGAPSNGLEERP